MCKFLQGFIAFGIATTGSMLCIAYLLFVSWLCHNVPDFMANNSEVIRGKFTLAADFALMAGFLLIAITTVVLTAIIATWRTQ